jgi:hypothetical protein
MVAELLDLYRATDQTVGSKIGMPVSLKSIGHRSPSPKVTSLILSRLVSLDVPDRMGAQPVRIYVNSRLSKLP